MTVIKAKDLSHLLSDEAKRRKASPLKEAFKDLQIPGIVSLGGGLPMPSLFPFDNLEVQTRVPPFEEGPDEVISNDKHVKVSLKKTYQEGDNKHADIPLAVSLQYGLTEGNNTLRGFLKEHTKMIHKPQYEDWDLILTIGNTHGWDATLRTLTNPGDVILAEEFTFSSALETVSSHGVKVVPVEMDLEGIVPEKLDAQLDAWVGPKPKLLYTIPTGQNPTGSTLAASRRAAIYKVAQKHDFFIVEDEPYYFLQMNPYTHDLEKRKALDASVTHEALINSLVDSFINFDVDGRVLRLDSVSKVLAPGARIGWVVGQANILERFVRLNEVSVQVASGFSQSIVNGIFQRWGQSGYLDWLIALRKTYSHRRDVCVDAIDEYIPKEISEFIAPTAGMFFWIKVDATKHPKYKEFNEDVLALEGQIYKTCIKNKVQVIPGHWFFVKDTKSQNLKGDSLFFRGTFCSVSPADLTRAIKLFAETLKEEFAL